MKIQGKMYSVLFNGITDALQLLEKEDVGGRTAQAVAILKEAQRNSEELFLRTGDRLEERISAPAQTECD